jgi:hypothetical protein
MATATVHITIRMRGRWMLRLARITAWVGWLVPERIQQPAISWLWARVRFEYRLGERGAWHRLDQPRLAWEQLP